MAQLSIPPARQTVSTERILLEVSSLSKAYPGVQALDEVDFDLHEGEVHCLIGENGAGKSTLVKILSGAQRPDSGELRFDDRIVTFDAPAAAQQAGIACIYQELSVVNGLTVAENIVLGDEPGPNWLFDRTAAELMAQDLLDSIGFGELKASMSTGLLSSAQKQAVMIAKALRQNAKVIIMDEPSSSLEDTEIRRLFEVIGNLRSQGKGIIYVSHKLREVNALGDRITVFKDGARVATVRRGEVQSEDLVRMMVGRDFSEIFPPKRQNFGEVVLEVKGLSNSVIKDIDLKVREGEILGIAGLVGAGRTELFRAIFGADNSINGKIWVNKTLLKRNSIHRAIEMGIALIPEERRGQGIIPALSVLENVTLPWNEFPRRRALSLSMQKAAEYIVKLLGVKTPDLDQRISALSGGNQQKLVVGKWLLMNTKVLLMDEPTRGIDIGAKREIYKIIADLARNGVAIMIVSSELPELLSLSNRLMVLNNGTVVGELTGKATEEEVIAMSMLHTSQIVPITSDIADAQTKEKR